MSCGHEKSLLYKSWGKELLVFLVEEDEHVFFLDFVCDSWNFR